MEWPTSRRAATAARRGWLRRELLTRSKNLLRDFCPEHDGKRAIAALTAAVMEGVPADLMRPAVDAPIEALLGRLSKRLYDHRGLDKRLARWAVESWAVSLGRSVPGYMPPLPTPSPGSVGTWSAEDIF